MGNRISSMDGWRAFGVIFVVLEHLLNYTSVRDIWPTYLLFLGHQGVIVLDGFFFISGYVITRGMLSEHRQIGRLSMRAFYLRRAARILPALSIYLVCVTVLGHLGVIDHRLIWSAYSALFACNLPMLGSCGWYLGHTWTLAYEEQFYVLLPMAMAWSLRHIRFGWLPALTILLWVGSATSTAAGLQQVATATHVGTLLLTGVSSAIYRERLFAAVEHWPRWLAVAGMPVLMTFPLWPDGTLLRVTYMLGSPLLIVLTLLAGARHGIAFTRLLETRPMVFGGQLSYTIYLWQQLATGFHGDQKTPAFHIIAIALVLLWSVVSYLLVERPMINWGAAHSRRILSGMRPAGTPQTPPVETLAAPLLVTPHHVLDTIDPPMP